MDVLDKIPIIFIKKIKIKEKEREESFGFLLSVKVYTLMKS